MEEPLDWRFHLKRHRVLWRTKIDDDVGDDDGDDDDNDEDDDSNENSKRWRWQIQCWQCGNDDDNDNNSDDDERRATWESVIIFGRGGPKNWECLLNEPVDWAARFGGRLGGRYADRFDAIGRQFCQSGAIEGNWMARHKMPQITISRSGWMNMG